LLVVGLGVVIVGGFFARTASDAAPAEVNRGFNYPETG
jgi:hypothetical protein